MNKSTFIKVTVFDNNKLLTTTGLNFIGGEEDDVTILCVLERGNTKLRLAEFGTFCAEAGRKDVDTCAGFEEAEEEDDEDSTLLAVDFALGMEDNGWQNRNKSINIKIPKGNVDLRGFYRIPVDFNCRNLYVTA